ncbi:DUF3833 family protein [Spiribacter sp. 2438]|uniref:DUF3833 domain-containing protein n=1 Tax=Spiribacter sp. 2438 TaxID=2666185 RepID=UPI0012B01DF3|nr:DUF3833 domain-containing protein [Spiribacter sp. 2438]QGM22044.1 DUF3833 family protein [Spiribacter sp. 2438]
MAPTRSGLITSLLLAVVLLAACAGPTPEDYADEGPEFRVEEFFDGRVLAWGMFQSRGGQIQRRFTVDIDGQVDGDRIVLDEHFVYDDGETERRVWEIDRIDDRTYQGTAGDIVGIAEGERAGNALNWQYTMALDVGDRTWNLRFDDWMVLVDENTLINTAEVTKFGFRVGTVTLFFRKADAPGLEP